MSSAAVSRTRPVATPRTRHSVAAPLRVVDQQPSQRGAVAFLVSAIVALLAVLPGNLYLNTQMVPTSYLIHDAEIELARLQEETQSLEQALQKVSSPQRLKQAAHAQGMVPSGATGFITLSDGTIEGGQPARR